jgi:tetratricopeptide (TPR) repeat protein
MRTSQQNAIALSLILAIGTFLAYRPVLSHDFVNLDDPDYVTENRMVLQGLTAEGIVWAVTTGHAFNWHPLTWLSLMLDVEIHGSGPRGFHLTNLLLHILCTLLLFLLLVRSTDEPWPAAMVAALFALHPLHVESVAWITERKDVLSTAFWLLTMHAYLSAVNKPSRTRWIAVAVLLALGLMAKPMLVTLPLVLLLFDFWPLGRIKNMASLRPLVIEKIPLFVIAAASAVITYLVQQAGGAVRDFDRIPLLARLGNAVLSYGTYLFQTFVPRGLAAHYPHRWIGEDIPVLETWISFAVLGIVTVLVLRAAGRRGYLLTGWLWYLVTLLPVIGLISAGIQGHADRYTYVPLIGVFLAMTFGVNEMIRTPARPWKILGILSAVAVVLLLAGATYRQTLHWRNSETLFRHALVHTQNNIIAHNNLGVALVALGSRGEAEHQFREALRIEPDSLNANVCLGGLLCKAGRVSEGVPYLQRAAQMDPENFGAQLNLGSALWSVSRYEEAVPYFERALEIDPDHVFAQENLARARAYLQQLPDE